jgi:hypothetical protein
LDWLNVILRNGLLVRVSKDESPQFVALSFETLRFAQLLRTRNGASA